MDENWAWWNGFFFLTSIFVAWISYAYQIYVRPARYTRAEKLVYAPVYFLSRVLWRVEIFWSPNWGQLNHEESKWGDTLLLRERLNTGAVIVANHRSSIDPFFIQLASGARVHWMVAGEYFKHSFFGPILRSYQAIPTNRGGMDNAATKKAIQYASQGDLVGMFPEGRINRTSSPLVSIRPGAAMVASRAQVPIVPIWIEGAPVGPEVYSPLFRSAHVRVYVGTPCYAPQIQPETSNFADGTNTNDLGYVKDRERDLRWIRIAMGEALKMGSNDGNAIIVAGKNWLT